MAANGNSVTILIGLDSVAGQTDVSFTETRDVFDTSVKGDDKRTLAAGRYSSSLTLDNLFVDGDSAYSALQTAVRGGTTVTVVRADSGGSTIESATAYVTSLSENFPDQDNSTVTVNLEITGAWA
jgi:flagellin-like hook-associated protein FlgL